MYQLQLSLDVYQRLGTCLSEIHPEIKLHLVSCDYSLASLGFVAHPPCTIQFDMTEQELEALLSELMQYETDAYNQADTQMPEKTPEYQAYVKYGWMWDILSFAEYIES